MALTKERTEMIANYLTADKDRAVELLKLSPEEALEKINEDGNSFTADEISEFGKELADIVTKMSNGEELDADTLEQVSGGANPMKGVADVCFFTGGAMGGLAAAGIAFWAMW